MSCQCRASHGVVILLINSPAHVVSGPLGAWPTPSTARRLQLFTLNNAVESPEYLKLQENRLAAGAQRSLKPPWLFTVGRGQVAPPQELPSRFQLFRHQTAKLFSAVRSFLQFTHWINCWTVLFLGLAVGYCFTRVRVLANTKTEKVRLDFLETRGNLWISGGETPFTPLAFFYNSHNG